MSTLAWSKEIGSTVKNEKLGGKARLLRIDAVHPGNTIQLPEDLAVGLDGNEASPLLGDNAHREVYVSRLLLATSHM